MGIGIYCLSRSVCLSVCLSIIAVSVISKYFILIHLFFQSMLNITNSSMSNINSLHFVVFRVLLLSNIQEHSNTYKITSKQNCVGGTNIFSPGQLEIFFFLSFYCGLLVECNFLFYYGILLVVVILNKGRLSLGPHCPQRSMRRAFSRNVTTKLFASFYHIYRIIDTVEQFSLSLKIPAT